MTESAERCAAARKDGSPCAGRPLAESGHCWAHAPGREAERAAVRKQGGANSSSVVRAARGLPPELRAAWALLATLINEVHSGTTPARSAEVIGGLVGRLLDLAKFAHEMGEAKEIAERLDILEGQVAEGSGRRW